MELPSEGGAVPNTGNESLGISFPNAQVPILIFEAAMSPSCLGNRSLLKSFSYR